MPVWPSKFLKQINQIKRKGVKNPNWPEANQLAIYKRGRVFELLPKTNPERGQSGIFLEGHKLISNV